MKITGDRIHGVDFGIIQYTVGANGCLWAFSRLVEIPLAMMHGASIRRHCFPVSSL